MWAGWVWWAGLLLDGQGGFEGVFGGADGFDECAEGGVGVGDIECFGDGLEGFGGVFECLEVSFGFAFIEE